MDIISDDFTADEPSIRLVHKADILDTPDTDEFTDPTEPGDEIAARASALRALLIDGLNAKSAEWRIKRRWSKLADKAPAIVASAQRTAENWKPGAERMIGGMLKRITSVELLNERFAMVAVPGQAACIAQISDALFMTRDDFSARLADSVIVTGVDNKGIVQEKDAAKVWLGDRRRRAASKIVFTSREVGPECFNLWTGFGVVPKGGNCALIHKHIQEVICAGREVEYNAFLNLLAWQVQNIGRASRIIVVLYSKEQQVGKGVLIEKTLPEIFGSLHGAFTSEYEHVFGRFNDFVRGKAFIGLDEACFAGDRKAADKIKSTAAAETMSIEGKGLPKLQCPVAVNIYLATNHEHAAHVEQYDARYWILKVSPHRKNDVSYWTSLFKEIEEGGIAAFLHDLLSRDVSNFVPQRDVPLQNAEHRANQRASDPANPALWLMHCLDNGLWLGSEKWESAYLLVGTTKKVKVSKGAVEMVDDPKGARMLPAFLDSSYRAWAATQGRHAQAATINDFWKLLTDFGFETSKSNGVRFRIVPKIKDLRAKVVEHLGVDDGALEEKESDSAGGDGRDSKFSLLPKMAGKSMAARISPGFSGESVIPLSLTAPIIKKSRENKVLGRNNRQGQSEGQSGTMNGTVGGGIDPVTVTGGAIADFYLDQDGCSDYD